MRSILLMIIFAFSLIAVPALAQLNPVLSVGPLFSVPIGDLDENADFGIGGGLRFEYPVLDNLTPTLSLDYIHFSEAKLYQTSVTNNAFIALAGLKFFPIKKLYVLGQAGVNLFNSKVETDIFNIITTTTLKKNKFIGSLGIGYEVARIFDLGVHYNLSDKANFINLRIAYMFNFK